MKNRYGLDMNKAIEDVKKVLDKLLSEPNKLEENIFMMLCRLKGDMIEDLQTFNYQEFLKDRLLRDLYVIAKNEFEGNGNYKILYAFLNLMDREKYQLEIEEDIYRFRYKNL